MPGIKHRRVVGRAPAANLVARARGTSPGRRLVLNGHLDTFPVGEARWAHSPLGADLEDGRIYGRGACDMKAGVAALVLAFVTLAEFRDAWRGELVLTLVGDEETGGRRGTQYLLANVEEAVGDAMLNADTGSPQVEKGNVWVETEATRVANHAAHVHLGRNAVDALVDVLGAVCALKDLVPLLPSAVERIIAQAKAVSGAESGEGEAKTLRRITVNTRSIEYGIGPLPDVSWWILQCTEPRWTNPEEAIVRAVRENLREMATICISPLRIAFDHIGMRKVYEIAIRMAADNTITSLSNYMLYNFMDTPSGLYERMKLNIALNEELKIRIWSFPMRYQPVTLKDRSHVGRNWNRYYLRSFQIMLQATHGVVSGNPAFFIRAYGEDRNGFERLLSQPHSFIFHREHYEKGDGRPVLDEYEALRRRLSTGQEQELIGHLAGPATAAPGLPRAHYRRLVNDSTIDPLIRNVMRFHTLDTKDRLGTEETIVLPAFRQLNPDPALPAEDEYVEDAGLYDEEGEDL